MNSRQSFRLFRLFGIDVFLHWSWFLVAAYRISERQGGYGSLTWCIAEYLGLFGMVLVHEFGHALACRQVGGTSREILLWPFGGVAYVNPPPRPGALLWSIAAGPLVNVVLIPVYWYLMRQGTFGMGTDGLRLVANLQFINFVLLIFNLLPIYPLDGGQILRALLWFVVGRARSLTVACVIGVLGAIGVAALALSQHSVWLGILAVLGIQQCWMGVKEARRLVRLAKLPRHDQFACPSCHEKPIQAALWLCPDCQKPFDTFASGAVCPNCGKAFALTGCPACRKQHSMAEWAAAATSIP